MSHFLDAEIIGLAGKTQPTRISFDRHVNIIYGLNGSGKTSLLRILHSAMNMDATLLGNVPFTEATVRVHSLHYNMDFTLQISKSDLSLPQEVERVRSSSTEIVFDLGQPVFLGAAGKKSANWKRSPKTPNQKGEHGFLNRYLPTSRLHVGADLRSHDRESRGPLTEQSLDQYFAKAVNALWVQYSSDVVRAVRDAQEKGLADILKGVLAGSGSKAEQPDELDLERGYESTRKFLERQGSPSVLGTFSEFKTRFTRDKSVQKVVKDIYQIEQAIDRAVTPQRQLEELIRKMYSGNKKVSFGDKSIDVENLNGQQIGLAALSSGEKHLIQLLVECLLAKESSILIDEPEISIHVDWQRELVAAFRTLNPEAQFILATHSPEVMSDVSDERIFAL